MKKLFSLYALLFLIPFLSFAQSISPNEELAKCTWTIKQLQSSRAFAEANVSHFAVEFDKAQQEIAALKAQIEKLQKMLTNNEREKE